MSGQDYLQHQPNPTTHEVSPEDLHVCRALYGSGECFRCGRSMDEPDDSDEIALRQDLRSANLLRALELGLIDSFQFLEQHRT